ncbi:cytochrome b [Neiella marina]|uniref:Cytochrome b n=1 Tax=Neiella marina TaxID=508461 RepID=A0A8J2XRZ6_9GAMM|nr:cytochrome b/b6 domain-containing protein [Neiella marina]GGA91228.1 cytochrome b [Neiella marina]
MNNRSNRLTRYLHWLMALILLLAMLLGFYMTYTESYQLYALHKSLAVIIALLFIFRLYWRQRSPWPSIAKDSDHERLVSGAHKLLLGLVALMLLSGISYSGFAGYGVALFGLEIIPSQYDPEGNAVPFHSELSVMGQQIHHYTGFVFSALVVCHIGAALKHHIVDKDNTLNRMLGKS